MKNQIKYLPMILLFYLISCTKKVPPTPLPQTNCSNCNCPEMLDLRSTPLADTLHKTNSSPGCMITPNYVSMGKYGYVQPVVNPNNKYEIAFIRNENESFPHNSELCTYNFCTNQLNVITDNAKATPDWSVKNWIVFTGNDDQLWKVKSTGDSLIQLTNTGTFNNRPTWSPDGDKLVYFDASSPGKSRISHANGESYKILDFYINISLWLNNENIIYSSQGNNKLRKYNLEAETSQDIVAGLGLGGGRISVLENGNLNFDGHHGTYLYDNLNLILIDSNYRTFRNFSSQPIGDGKLLFHRLVQDTSGYEDCTIYSWSLLTLYDLETGSERQINFPE